MNIAFVMTLLGRDQPGIVEAVSAVIATHGGNWEQSRMARLSGRFAGFIRISAPQNVAEDLQAGLLALARDGLALRVDRVDEPEAHVDVARATLDVIGQDRPGILREITAALASRGVNVIRLETDCKSAPMSGEMLFHARAELLCPAELEFETLRETLELIGDDLMVEVSLVAPAIASA